MNTDLDINLSYPFEKAMTNDNPVKDTFLLIEELIERHPAPQIKDKVAQSATLLICAHLLNLLKGTGLLNGAGFHAPAISLFRTLEDALDCFIAVGISKDAAQKWFDGKLKASDAAKIYIEQLNDNSEKEFLSKYRLELRNLFNDYSHCSSIQANWNLYFKRLKKNKGTLELNIKPLVVNSNAHRIDCHIIAHLFEFIEGIEIVYRDFLESLPVFYLRLKKIKESIIDILEEHQKHGCMNVLHAPELEIIKNKA
jgi:hypothetical protein